MEEYESIDNESGYPDYEDDFEFGFVEEYESSDNESGYPDYEDNFEFGLEEETRTIAGSQQIEVISKESLLAAQRDDLLRVMDVLSLKEHDAWSLLIHYSWDVEKLLSVLVEKGEDEVYAEAGVTLMERNEDLFSFMFSSSVMCMICVKEVPGNKVTTMECGHYFCNTCWTEHFISKINESQSEQIRCMAHQCNAICDISKVRTLVSTRDPHLAEKFDQLLLESYIEANRKVKWCPSVPHCGNAIRVDGNVLCEVECACGLQFCFKCLSEAHSPCSCLMWELWNKSCQGKSETVKCILEQTKICPECYELFEKDGECDLRTFVSGEPFCLLCGRHAYDSCGGFQKEKQVKIRHRNKDIWYYLHYHHRYRDQTQTFDLERKLKQAAEDMIFLFRENYFKSRVFCWVFDAFNRVSKARRILSFTYPFAYCMFGPVLFKDHDMPKQEIRIKQNIFDAHLQQLVENIERLSSLLEKPFEFYEEDSLMKLKMQIVNHSAVTDKLCKNLYDCIENDLLGPLQSEIHNIAPYKSNGVEKASDHCL
ncbi:probable E3 ubiquitin-protein ligase ARI1 isoform X2 [Morus notabilis]|uniref:probable E3 ubiquitin-protein ligase ARI1 isoform X2 n=1 Tax=Morus notabilis TaxID=981085 RepID=UPI000CED0B06|nr:probable E3 ubiquitin-protein ligase ARI1 isoform X2 [Morus notabilis]